MITIYDDEKSIAGIENNAIAFNLLPEVINPENEFKVEASANPNQLDLFYLKSILVSVGWNANDDVFDKNEVWTARATPVDKQFNFMHNEKDIIGHITSTQVIAGQTEILDIKDLPDQFDVSVGSVIYKRWQDPQLQERIEQLIAEIKEGKWFVSMECLFRNFDYAFITPENEHKIVARSSQTSFLTKHLKIYGGSGEFQGNKIGRLLRDFTFSGKGLVDNPANKRSTVTNYSDFSEESIHTAAKEKVMPAQYTEAEFKALEDKLAKAEKVAQDAADKAKSKEVEDYQNKITALEDQVKVSTEKVKELEQKVSVSKEVDQNKDQKIAALEKEKTELATKVAEQTEAIKKVELEKLKATRLGKFATREVAEDKAKTLVDKFMGTAEELFDELVNSFPAKADVKPESKKTEKVVAEDDFDLDNDPAMAISNTDEAKDLRTKASAYFADVFKNKIKGE